MATIQKYKRDDQIEVASLPPSGILDTLYIVTGTIPNTLWRWDGIAFIWVWSVADADNGLSIGLDGKIELGGILHQDTIVENAGFNLGFGDGIAFNGLDNISVGRLNNIDSSNIYVVGEVNTLTTSSFIDIIGSNNIISSTSDANIIGNRNTIDIANGSSITAFNSILSNLDNSNVGGISSTIDGANSSTINAVDSTIVGTQSSLISAILGNYNGITASNLIGSSQSIYNTNAVNVLGNTISIDPADTLTNGTILGNSITLNNSVDSFGIFGNNITVDSARDTYGIGQNLVLTTSNTIDIGLVDATKATIDDDGRLTLRGALAPNGDDGVLGEILVSQGVTVAPIWTATNNITGVAKVVNISSAGYTVLANDEVIRLASGFTGTVTMPLASASYDATTSNGRMITIVNHSAGNRQTSISYQTGSVTATTTIPNNTEIKLMFNGTIWFLISN